MDSLSLYLSSKKKKKRKKSKRQGLSGSVQEFDSAAPKPSSMPQTPARFGSSSFTDDTKESDTGGVDVRRALCFSAPENIVARGQNNPL